MVAETDSPGPRLVPRMTPEVYIKLGHTLKSKKDVGSAKLYLTYIVPSSNLASWPSLVSSANKGSCFDSMTLGAEQVTPIAPGPGEPTEARMTNRL